MPPKFSEKTFSKPIYCIITVLHSNMPPFINSFFLFFFYVYLRLFKAFFKFFQRKKYFFPASSLARLGPNQTRRPTPRTSQS